MIYTVTMTSINGEQDYRIDVETDGNVSRARRIASGVIAAHVSDRFTGRAGTRGIPWLGDTRTTRVTISLDKQGT